jgi:phosphoribosylanthranilate isomerase
MFRHEDIVAVNAVHPDMVGFVVNVPSSHRSVSLDALSRLANSVDPSIVRVGVFVDEKPETIVHVVAHASIDVVQLHGHEDEAYVLDLRTRLSATGCQIRESVKRVMPHRPRTTPSSAHFAYDVLLTSIAHVHLQPISFFSITDKEVALASTGPLSLTSDVPLCSQED